MRKTKEENVNLSSYLFQAVIDEWFKQKQTEVKPSTLHRFESIKRLHIEPYFKEKSVDEINKEDIENWLKNFRKYKYQTRKSFLAVLNDVFEYAIHQLHVNIENPTESIEVTKFSNIKINQAVNYHNEKELNRLLYFLDSYRDPQFPDYQLYYTFIHFLAHSGLRIREALALTWDDFIGNQISVNKVIVQDAEEGVKVSPIKSKIFKRTITLDKETVTLLNAFKKNQKNIQKNDANFKLHPDNVIFQTTKGKYLEPSSVRMNIKRFCFNANVDYKGIRAFRHTFAVIALRSGESLVSLSKILGNASTQKTTEIYL